MALCEALGIYRRIVFGTSMRRYGAGRRFARGALHAGLRWRFVSE